jgi:hypothetical protein
MLRRVEAGPDTVTIPGRFNGPPGSANGGYACGTVAALLGPGPAEVVLRSPPPLDRPLSVIRDGQSVALRDGETLVAEGRRLQGLDLEPIEPIGIPGATEASRGYPWREEHVFPTCFVCGPRREAADGLEIFAGRAGGRSAYAAAWTPALEFATDGGEVDERVVWAALDCPTAVAACVTEDEEAVPGAVLGTLAASVDAPLRAGQPHSVVAWLLGVEGRKRAAAAAIFDGDGALRARSRALWIELRSAG